MSQDDAQWRAETLERDGWTRRFTAVGSRLNEAVKLYDELGFEITLEPGQPGDERVTDSEACEQCFVMSLARTIYTRPRSVAERESPAER